jgi:hypothetical protein
MKNFVRLNKNEMKMVMGGTTEDEVGEGTIKCNGGGSQYTCSLATVLDCTVECGDTHGTTCMGCGEF